MGDAATTAIEAWFNQHLPDEWRTPAPEVTVDDEEILVLISLEGEFDSAAAEKTAVKEFRETTREQRIRIATEAQATFHRKVSWGVRTGTTGRLFTHLSIPAMTRLRIRERKVLDTLVGAGVARSRSEALAWCVREVGKHMDEWLAELDEALEKVAEVRDKGPAG